MRRKGRNDALSPSCRAVAPLAFLATATAWRYPRLLAYLLLTSTRAGCANALSTLTLTVLDLVHGHDSYLINVMKPGWFLERILAKKQVSDLNETAILLPSSTSRTDLEHAYVHSFQSERAPRRSGRSRAALERRQRLDRSERWRCGAPRALRHSGHAGT